MLCTSENIRDNESEREGSKMDGLYGLSLCTDFSAVKMS